MSQPDQDIPRKGPLPLVIAVTGHRDLRESDIEALKKEVEVIFRELADRYPFTAIELLSGLAEGADRVAAQVALNFGLTLVACLPMPKSLYESDFETNESRRQFEELLGKARKIIVLPLIEGLTTHSISEQHRRDLQYQALADYLVKHCQILIALWDGVDTKLVGGTAAVVKAQLRGTNPCYGLDFPETGPVYHIATPRQKNPVPRDPRRPDRPIEPLTRISLFHFGFENEQAARTNHERICTRMDQFNRDALKKQSKLNIARVQSKDWLLPPEVRNRVSPALSSLFENYSTTDALAIHYQALTRWIFWLLFFVFGLGTLVCFELFSHGPENWRIPLLALYMLLIGVGYRLYRLARRKQFQTKYLDYRALAEGLRVQIFWRFAGLDDQVADHYLRKQKSDLDWVRNAIRVWSAAVSRDSHHEINLPVVQKHWVQNQADYFTKRAKKNHAEAKREDRATQALLVLTIVVALAVWVASLARKFDEGLHEIVAITMALLPGVAGALAGYGLKMAHREQGKQYQRMHDIFKHGAVCLDWALLQKDDALAKRVVRDLGEEALAENGDWVLLHRERAIELPWR